MSCSKALRLTQAAVAAMTFLYSAAFAQTAQSHNQNSGSMFKTPPSIASTQKAPVANSKDRVRDKGQAMRIERRADGSVVLQGKMHGGGGVQTKIVVPNINYDVRIDGPAGVDESGRAVTWQQKINREMAHAIVYKGLQAQGYNYKEHLKKQQGVVTQLDMWKAKTEATRDFVKKNGPITTRSFIVPGSTPEISDLLTDPEVGVRMENGKRVYYYKGKRIDLYAKPEAQHKFRVRKATEERTKLSVSAKRKDSNSHTVEIRKTPPKKAYEVAPEEDLRRNPTDVLVDPSTLPTVVDLQKLFPSGLSADDADDSAETNDTNETEDQGKAQRKFQNGNGKAKGRPVSEVEFGAFGNGMSLEFKTTFKTFKNLPSSLLIGLLSFCVSDAYAQLPKQSALDAVSASEFQSKPLLPDAKQESFSEIIREIKRVNDGIVKRVQNRAGEQKFQEVIREIDRSKNAGSTSETDKTSAQPDFGTQADTDSFLEFVTDSDGAFDPAEFAANVVNKTKSVTPEQFEEDVKAITGALSKPGKSPVDALADMLESNPEIYTAIPDADKRLAALSGKLIEIEPADPMGEGTYVFISYSLGESALKKIVERNKNRKDVTLVMRGVPKGMNIPEGVKKIQAIAASVEPIASVIIDPGLFREYGITTVPSVARVGRAPSPLTLLPEERKARRYAPLVAKVEGLDNDAWLKEKIQEGLKGDLGIQGNLLEIAEPDLIEEMKKRVAMIDWEKKKQEAAKRFWKTRRFDVLPTADQARVREIDPTILVKDDIQDLAGRYIRKAGDKVNPLQIRPFTQTVLVFNPVSEDEMQRIQAFLAERAKAGLSKPVLIATQIDKANDWDGYQELTDKLDSHVFLMTPEVQYQWRIEKTPSVITADNRRHIFVVRELGPVEPTDDVNQPKTHPENTDVQ